MNPQVHGYFDPLTNTISYIVHGDGAREAAIIDPVLDFDVRSGRLATDSADALMAQIETRGLELKYVLETHAHADHLSAGDYIREKTGAKIVIGAHIDEVQKVFAPRFEADDVQTDGAAFDILMAEGDMLPLGNLEIAVLHTPGHTPADISYLIGDAVFVGDTMFMPDYGTARADFPGGDAHMLYRSIRRLLDLPPETRMFVCHDYLPEGRSEHRWETTVGEQRARNVHVHEGVSEEEFVAMRCERDLKLAAPTLLLPSLQVNIRAGSLPPASPAGQVFLRLPVTLTG